MASPFDILEKIRRISPLAKRLVIATVFFGTLVALVTTAIQLYVDYRRERLELSDGDFLDFDWVDGEVQAPVVVLFHGLEGDSSSGYARNLMHSVKARGWNGVVAHFRGTSSHAFEVAEGEGVGAKEEAGEGAG